MRVYRPKMFAEVYHGDHNGYRLVWVVRCVNGDLVNCDTLRGASELLSSEVAAYADCWLKVAR